MSAGYSGKLLVSILLVVCSGRIFFIKRERIDNLSTLSAIALAASILQIPSNGLDAVSASLCVVSLFSFLTNIHALSRLANKVFIDHYNPLFVVFSLISLVLSAFLCFLTVYFADITVSPAMMRKMMVKESKVRYTITDGKAAECTMLEMSNANAVFYEPLYTVQGKKVAAILAADKRADTAGYSPYMAFLAAEGFTVMTGEFEGARWFLPPFGGRMLRRLCMLASWMLDRKDFERQREFYTFAIIKEYETMLNIARSKMGDENGIAFCLISDDMSDAAARAVAHEREDVIGVFSLSSVLAMPGFGFVQQTDPLLAWHLHLKRDRTLDAPRKAAKDTAQAFRQCIYAACNANNTKNDKERGAYDAN